MSAATSIKVLLTSDCKWFGNEVMMMSASYPKVSGTQKHGDVCGIISGVVELDAQTKREDLSSINVYVMPTS